MTPQEKRGQDRELEELWGNSALNAAAPALEAIKNQNPPRTLRAKLIQLGEDEREQVSLWRWMSHRAPVFVPALATLLVVLYIPTRALLNPTQIDTTPQQPTQAQPLSAADEDDLFALDGDSSSDLFDQELQLMEETI